MSIEIEVLNGDASWPQAQPLIDAVWPPHVLEKLPWGDVVFAHADLRVLVQSEDQGLVCHVGIFRREVTWNGRKMLAGGIGGVATRADSRRRVLLGVNVLCACGSTKARPISGCCFVSRTTRRFTWRAAGSPMRARCTPSNRRKAVYVSRRWRPISSTSAARRCGAWSTYAACRGDLCVPRDGLLAGWPIIC